MKKKKEDTTKRKTDAKKTITKKSNNKKTIRKTTTRKSTKKKNNAFTLIELLAVIIILGVLMIIAIPSVTTYISDSRKNSYIDTAKNIVGGARNIANEGKLGMYDTDTTYYLRASCINTENGLKSPYGDFTEAYVGVTFDGKGYNYYWISTDSSGQGVKDVTPVDKLDIDKIEANLTDTEIKEKVDKTGVDGRSKIQIINDNCNSWGSPLIASTQVGSDGENYDPVIYPEGKTKETVSLGEVIKVGTEEFYVLKHDGDKLVVLSRYNINVGPNKKTDVTEGIQNSAVLGSGVGITAYGNMKFSSNNYWMNKVGSGLDYPGNYAEPNYPYVYDDNCEFYQYIENYKNYLKDNGLNVIEARPIKYSELAELGCKTYDGGGCSGSNVPSFIKETTFWTGNASYNYNVLFVRSYGLDSYVNENPFPGIRPVIVI